MKPKKQEEQQTPPGVPNVEMMKVFEANKVRALFKKEGPDTLLWCNYSAHTKQKNGQGFEVWGRGQEVVEHITRTVLAFYPKAEVTSQHSNAHIVFRLNG
jgi:hypothetical protein